MPTYASYYDKLFVGSEIKEGSRNTSGDGTAILAAPGADVRYLIKSIELQIAAAGPLDVVIKSGSTAIRTVRMVSDGDGYVRVYDFEYDILACGINEALYLSLSSNIAVNYRICVVKEQLKQID